MVFVRRTLEPVIVVTFLFKGVFRGRGVEVAEVRVPLVKMIGDAIRDVNI